MIEAQVDVVIELAHPATLADLDRHRARDYVARGEILGGGRVAFHEALALGVDQIATLAARALGDQTAGAVDPGRMELDKLHVLQRQAGTQHHRVAVTRAGVGAGASEVHASVAAGRQYCLAGTEAVDRAVVELERDDATAPALVVHDQVDGEIFDEELRRMAQRLAVQGMEDGVAGTVGSSRGTLRRALAVVDGHAAKRTLIDLALLGTRERHAPVIELVDRLRSVAAQILDRVLVS